MRRIAPWVVVGIMVALAVGGCGDLSRAELRRGVDGLGSIASEGRLVAKGVAADDTKSTFVRAHVRTLAQSAQHEAEKLADTHSDARYERQRLRAVRLARRLAGELSTLQTWPGDEAVGRRSQRRLDDLTFQFDELAQQL